ncbi:hypothetical protein K443DRAFT_553250 [Laccaria amethystina LaAM-08-1]|uniref:Allergen n=1 Tax=Laccaria amethystina LaAM-08-1 TaxID=1095629 RepID=A0A0C9X9M2_9AGAR|nr:hypothetical protein K443DRAFT_553250 [Laccaria amethystina LaAM-08-1]
MGIGSAVKNMLSGDENNPNPNSNSIAAGDDSVPETTASSTTAATPANKLPAGSGPGTTGRTSLDNPTTRTSGELDPPGDYSTHPSGQPTSNPETTGKYGAAAAASPFAVGAGLTGTASTGTTKKRGNSLFGVRSSKEVPKTTTTTGQPGTEVVVDGRPSTDLDRSNQVTRPERAASTGGVVPAQKGGDVYETEGTHRRGLFGTGTGTGALKHHLHSGTTSAALEPHHVGRIVDLPRDAKDVEQITDELNPVTHELVRCIETEEVSRVQEHERHIHHIQHHMQPLIAREELVEEHTNHRYPPTQIREVVANNVEDTALLDGLLRQHQDTCKRAHKERIIVDKGTIVNEHVHHHIHHIIQPVIEKETIDKRRIHATIPIHTVTHEAPVVHQSQVHDPVPIETFVKAHGAVPQSAITKKVLQGQNSRHVDGVAEELERDLNLGKDPREDKVGGGGQSKLSQRPMSGGGDAFTKPAAGTLSRN